MNAEEIWDLFECERCGRCCREIGLPHDPAAVRKIADRFSISTSQVIERYYGRSRRGGDWESQPEKRIPCPFLTEENLCSIHDIRPYGCRAYPLDTNFGRSEIDCPACEDFEKRFFVEEAVNRGDLTFWKKKEIYDERYGYDFSRRIIEEIDERFEKMIGKEMADDRRRLYREISAMLNELSEQKRLNPYYRGTFRRDLEEKMREFLNAIKYQ